MNQPRSPLSLVLAVVFGGNFFLACGAPETREEPGGSDFPAVTDPFTPSPQENHVQNATPDPVRTDEEPSAALPPLAPGGDETTGTNDDDMTQPDQPAPASEGVENTGGAAGTAGASSPPTAAAGTLVPLYTYPTHPSWAAIVAARSLHPEVAVIAVVNPSNGPGTRANADYLAGIAKLQAAGIKVLGYVATGYTQRTELAVRADIDRWRSFYPGVTGIFFDEMANTAGLEDYYRRQTSYARSLGLNYTVGNPGADTRPTYVGVVDMILVYENAGLRPLSSWHDEYPRESFGIIPYAVAHLDTSYIQQAKKTVGFIYMTDDVLTNPWDSLPSYFPDLLAALAS